MTTQRTTPATGRAVVCALMTEVPLLGGVTARWHR